MLDTVVRGVGGAASGPAEANLLGNEPLADIVASAAFRLRVMGGIVKRAARRGADEHSSAK